MCDDRARIGVRSLAATCFALALAGCAALAPRMEPLHVGLESVRVVRIAPPAAQLAIGLVVSNPNAADIALDTLDARLVVAGETLAHSQLRAPALLRAGAQTAVVLDTRADASVALAVAGHVLGSGAQLLPYELAGVAIDASGRRFPFSRRGVIPLAAIGAR